ncbi:hypothetical protein MUK42_25981 [Musa troglodytarum]|uniref:DUF4408 domain-containing protein n=1 Tax=Musa troglodytarum TaxID=320322 RepID=A0A9E7JBE2_9LILI|nr:hypothetical protein MUK42_25981 [Musa troglodytarum]
MSPPLFTPEWLAMEKLPRSQMAKGAFLLILLVFVPFISSSLRTSYLYFLLNILIVALGVEAGFLDAISRHQEEKKAHNTAAAPTAGGAAPVDAANHVAEVVNRRERAPQQKPVVQKSAKGAPGAQTLKRCPSKPSLFFIGGFEGDSAGKEWEEEEEEEEAGELSTQELFAKAEAFIGNFYVQLKMQREESWNKIQGLYHRAF